jgi:hypothetical protein
VEVVYERCAGLDVHKKSITACVLWTLPKGKKKQEKRRFATFTQDLLAMADWLRESGVTHVAMESTGVYWKPVWNILEGQFEILLVNAQHIKAVPGRKTDQKDSEWIADLLQHGLLKGSFVPPTPVRELRDLTRYRVGLAQECNRIANRVQKVLEDANVKSSWRRWRPMPWACPVARCWMPSLLARATATNWQRCPKASCARSGPNCNWRWKVASLSITVSC